MEHRGVLMRWTKDLVEYWIENYPSLKDYTINYHTAFYDDGDKLKGKAVYSRAPFEMQAILNAEFDLGLKALKRFYGEDIRNVLGSDIWDAKIKKGWAIGMLKGLLFSADRGKSDWMCKVI